MPDWLAFLIILLLSGVLLVLLAAWLMARALLRPPRMTDAKANWVLGRISPQDIGLPYHPLRFDVRDPLTAHTLSLAAWWIPHPDARGRCVVLVHGYADAKIGAIAWAPVFHELGYNVLALDLRAHGESSGAVTTAGFYERDDLNEVINRLRIDRPNETRHLVLFGASMGAAVVCAAAVERDDLFGVILESPFADFRHAAMTHFDLLGLPGRFLQQSALRLAERMTRARFDDLRPPLLIPRLRCPVLLIESGDDPFLSESDRAALRAAIDEHEASTGLPSARHVAENVPHLRAVVERPQEFRAWIAGFLGRLAPSNMNP